MTMIACILNRIFLLSIQPKQRAISTASIQVIDGFSYDLT